MSKRVFIFLLFMMSISLIGIIFIQSYFIIQNYEGNNSQFTSNVNYVLNQTSSMAERSEFRRYVRKFRDLISSESTVDTTSIKNLYIINEDPKNRETIVYRNGVIEENIVIPKTNNYYDDFFNIITDKDNISITRLSKLDNESLKRIDVNNPRRVIRALEITLSTKKPYSAFLKSKNRKSKYNNIIIGLNRNRYELHEIINKRVDKMIKRGLIDEVSSLTDFKELNALNTIGYSEIFKYLNEEYSYDKAIKKIKTNSRRYAKRQLTWFNSNKSINWFIDKYDIGEIIKLIETT